MSHFSAHPIDEMKTRKKAGISFIGIKILNNS